MKIFTMDVAYHSKLVHLLFPRLLFYSKRNTPFGSYELDGTLEVSRSRLVFYVRIFFIFNKLESGQVLCLNRPLRN